MTTFEAKKTLDGKRVKRSRHYENEEDFVWVDWYPCVMGTVEDIVPELGDSRPGDTEGVWGYTCTSLDTETSAKDESYVVVTWKKPKRLDDDPGLSETKRIPGFGLPGKDYGTRVFLAPDDTAEETVASRLSVYDLWPRDAGKFPRVIVDVSIERKWRVGLARIVVQYQVLSQDEWLVANIGKGLLFMDVGGESQTLNYDTEGEPIVAEGWESATTRYRWSLYSGSNVVLKGRGVYAVRVALKSPWSSAIAALAGHWNKSACPRMGLGCQIGTLMLLKCPMTLVPNTDEVYICDFYLAYDPDGWDQGCQAIKELFEFRSLEVKDRYDNYKLLQSVVGVWDAGGTPTIEDRKVATSDSGLMYTINSIDMYLEWSHSGVLGE